MNKLSRGARHALTLAIVTVVVGVGYYFFIQLTGLSIPCFFRELTGLKCSGCGMTHMFVHHFHLEFKEAFESNQAAFFLWPVIAFEVLFVTYLGGNDRDVPKWNLVIIYIIFAIMMIFGIIRNIGAFNLNI